MKIDDLGFQRENMWFNATLTLVEVSDIMDTKEEQNEFDQSMQTVQVRDASGDKFAMTVYVPDTPGGLEPIPTDAGYTALFKVKHKDGYITGVLTEILISNCPY